jgi:nucleoside-diphosphate-sugar epimerase
MSHQPKIYVAGHRGMVGSAIVRVLQKQGHNNIVTRTHVSPQMGGGELRLVWVSCCQGKGQLHD